MKFCVPLTIRPLLNKARTVICEVVVVGTELKLNDELFPGGLMAELANGNAVTEKEDDDAIEAAPLLEAILMLQLIGRPTREGFVFAHDKNDEFDGGKYTAKFSKPPVMLEPLKFAEMLNVDVVTSKNVEKEYVAPILEENKAGVDPLTTTLKSDGAAVVEPRAETEAMVHETVMFTIAGEILVQVSVDAVVG